MPTVPMQMHITPKPIDTDDTGPQVIIGFTGQGFSQAVMFDVPLDVQEGVKVADMFYKGIIEAFATAMKEWNNAEGTAPEVGEDRD